MTPKLSIPCLLDHCKLEVGCEEMDQNWKKMSTRDRFMEPPAYNNLIIKRLSVLLRHCTLQISEVDTLKETGIRQSPTLLHQVYTYIQIPSPAWILNPARLKNLHACSTSSSSAWPGLWGSCAKLHHPPSCSDSSRCRLSSLRGGRWHLRTYHR